MRHPIGFKRATRIFGLAALLLAMLVVSGLAGPANEARALNPPVDVVFMIDESGSMGNDHADVIANLGLLDANLSASLDPAYALVGFGGASSHQNPHTHTNFTDQAGLNAALLTLVLSGGFEPGVAATSYAMNNITGYRSGAGVCAVLISDEDSDGGDLATARNDLDARGATWFGIVDPNWGSTAVQYGPNPGSLSAHTGGMIFDIVSFRADPVPVFNALTNACIAAVLQGITLEPIEDTNPAGTDHSVTATVTDTLGDPVVGTDVTFEVIAGPNIGEMAVIPTDGNGEAVWTYASNGLIGTDQIIASFVDQDGNTQTAGPVIKRWIDGTPPEVSCDPTTNPHGKNVPRAGEKSKGQNEDGFYELTAVDNVDPDPLIFVNGFGPFASGDRVKVTEAPGSTPRAQKMGSSNGQAGAVTTHLILNDDAVVTAIDINGNASSTTCLVPPPPK